MLFVLGTVIMTNEQPIKALESKLNNLKHLASVFENVFKEKLNVCSDILLLSIIIFPFVLFKIVYDGQDLLTLSQTLWYYFLICEFFLCCILGCFLFAGRKYSIKLFKLESLDFIKSDPVLSSYFKNSLIKNGEYVKVDFEQSVRRYIKETELELTNLKAIELTQFFKPER